jgi:hypothetical protein
MKKLSPKAKGAMATVAIAALERLSDPKVRAQLADQGRQLADQVATWRTQRQVNERGLRSRRLRRLQDRAANLRTSIVDLGAERPELSRALGPPTTLLDEVDTAIAVASRLPADKRRAADKRIATELDRLEQLVLEAALPSS